MYKFIQKRDNILFMNKDGYIRKPKVESSQGFTIILLDSSQYNVYMRKVITQNRHIVTRYLVIYWFTHGLLFIYKKMKRYLSCNLTVRIIHKDSYIWKPIAIIMLDWNHLRKTITQNINTIKWYSLNLLKMTMYLVIYCQRHIKLITQFICISFFGIIYGICLIFIYDFINHPPPPPP